MEPDQLNAGGVESRALTGLRGLAAMLVMAHHLFLQIGLDQHIPILRPLLQKGYLGVDLFFVLSGFVLSMTYGTWFDGSRPVSLLHYGRFLSRRVARLWPLHAAVLAVLVIMHLTTRYTSITPLRLVANLGMIQAWGWSAEINPPAWSVSTEFLAYLLFPGLAWVTLRGRNRPLLCVTVIVVSLVACMYFAPPLGPGRRGRLDIYFNYSVLPALRCLAGFALGMLAWRIGRITAVQQIARQGWVGPLAFAAFLAAVLGRNNDLAIYPLFPIIVLGMHYGTGPVQRALSFGPLHRLGVLSYAVYLIHYTLLTWFPFDAGPMRVMLPAYLLAAWLLAELAHRLIEVPGRSLLRRFGELALGWSTLVFGPAPAPALKPPLGD